nr:MAG TPA: hypothetical protein [Caudoviricetes sp.]
MFYVADDNERDIDLSETEELEDADDLEDGDEPDDGEDEADDSAEDDGADEDGDEGEEDDGGEPQGDDGAADDGEKFPVKWLDETKELTREEVIRYAQKGMDYDRTKQALHALREEADALRAFKAEHEAQIDELTAYLKEAGKTSLGDVLDDLRVSELIGKGDSADLAREKIRAARLERQLAANTQRQTEQDEGKRKAQADLEAFQKEYPDVKVDEALLKELGDDLKATGNLTRAYEKMQRRKLEADNAALRKQIEADKQKASNKRRTTGSQKSAGSVSGKRDPLIAALLSDD